MTATFFEETHIIHRRHRLLNAVHTWLLVGGSLALLAVTAWAIAGTTGLIYAVGFGAVTLVMSRRISPAMVLRMYKARPVTPQTFPAGYRIVEELSRRAGLAVPPRLHVIPSNMMNAFAVGRREDSAIAVTDALVRSLTTRELAGVLAHEITHIRNEDIKVMSLADMVSRFTSTLSTMGLLAILFNVSGFFPAVPWLGIIAMIAAPTVGGLLQMALSRTREFDADYGAALLTGDPDGLSSALTKLEQAWKRRLEGMMLPTSRMAEPSLLRSHPPTPERVARLEALKETMVAGRVPHMAPPQVSEPGRPATSPVPRIRPRLARMSDAEHRGHWSALAASLPPSGPVVDGADADCAACAGSLNPPDAARPRIRVSRGGVWW